jgi:cbb3-type cytochrome oxidase cytochrome c subunit
MKLKKKILLSLIAGFIIIQFIQPVRNTTDKLLPAELENIYTVPGDVSAILKNSCYDCHSNNTRYPWYSNIQPAGWLLAKHIRDGKAELNFSEFGFYSNRRQQSKLQSIVNSIKDETMPLYAYTLIHRNAELTTVQKKVVTEWIIKTKDSLAGNN